MKRDYNSIEAIVIYTDRNEIAYVNCNYNPLYKKDSVDFEYWNEYDVNENIVHFKSSDGFESWRSFDKNNNLIQYRDSDHFNFIYEYNENNKLKHSKGYRNGIQIDEAWYDTEQGYLINYIDYTKDEKLKK